MTKEKREGVGEPFNCCDIFFFVLLFFNYSILTVGPMCLLVTSGLTIKHVGNYCTSETVSCHSHCNNVKMCFFPLIFLYFFILSKPHLVCFSYHNCLDCKNYVFVCLKIAET